MLCFFYAFLSWTAQPLHSRQEACVLMTLTKIGEAVAIVNTWNDHRFSSLQGSQPPSIAASGGGLRASSRQVSNAALSANTCAAAANRMGGLFTPLWNEAWCYIQQRDPLFLPRLWWDCVQRQGSCVKERREKELRVRKGVAWRGVAGREKRPGVSRNDNLHLCIARLYLWYSLNMICWCCCLERRRK